MKADNIRVALEKIKEAQVKKVGLDLKHSRKKDSTEICVVHICVSDYVHVPESWHVSSGLSFLGQVSVTPH